MEVRDAVNVVEVFSPGGALFATFKIWSFKRAKAEARLWRRAKWVVRLNGVNVK